MTGYRVTIIAPEEKNRLMFKLYKKGLYEAKAGIHGACVKLFTDNPTFMEMWKENFEQMPDCIRPHVRVFATGKGKNLKVLYELVSKTVIIKNCDYYGWLKSIALGAVADFMEDFVSEHRRYSVHGSFVDHRNRGIALIGPSGAGKTTLTYGLLLDKKCSFLTDDWFFVRMIDGKVLVYASERNSYIRNNLGEAWPQISKKLKNIKLDNKGRAIVNVSKFFGRNRIKKESVLKKIILLTREKGKPLIKKLSQKEAIEFMLANDFCNPHQLVRTRKKLGIRKEFFKELFKNTDVYLVNTIESPQESLDRIKKLL